MSLEDGIIELVVRFLDYWFHKPRQDRLLPLGQVCPSASVCMAHTENKFQRFNVYHSDYTKQ